MPPVLTPLSCTCPRPPHYCYCHPQVTDSNDLIPSSSFETDSKALALQNDSVYRTADNRIEVCNLAGAGRGGRRGGGGSGTGFRSATWQVWAGRGGGEVLGSGLQPGRCGQGGTGFRSVNLAGMSEGGGGRLVYHEFMTHPALTSMTHQPLLD